MYVSSVKTAVLYVYLSLGLTDCVAVVRVFSSEISTFLQDENAVRQSEAEIMIADAEIISSRAAAPVCGLSRGTTARSVRLSWGARKVGSPCPLAVRLRHHNSFQQVSLLPRTMPQGTVVSVDQGA